MPINIKIDEFEGPLDLLLHLIKKTEVDIYDIPIAKIADQYLGYLKAMEELDLDIASEFLVMAATLVEIKSKMLLPKRKKEEDLEEKDPRLELVEKLIEYKKYKEFAGSLKEIEDSTVIYFKSPEIIDDIDNEDIFFKNITVENLMIAFKRIMDNYDNRHKSEERVYENISSDEYKIEDKMNTILNLLADSSKIYFHEFFMFSKSKLEIIVTFIAMLELIKLREIQIYQINNFDKITIERRV